MRRRVIALVSVLFAALLSLFPTAAYADVDDFTFTSFTGDYYLSRATDGSAELYVVETWVADFPTDGEHRGIVRALPRTESGIDLETSVVDVRGADGEWVYWSTENDGDDILVLTGDDQLVTGPQTYTISYTMSNVVVRYSDTQADEFTWDTTGLDHAQPIDDARATVHLTGTVATDLLGDQTACYQGAAGSTATCDLQGPMTDSDAWPSAVNTWLAWHGASAGGAQSFTVDAGALAPNENVTVSVGFRLGAFAASSPPPPPPYPWWQWGFPAGIVLVALLTYPAALLVRALSRRNPDDEPVVVQYTPPPDQSVTLSAGVMDRPERALAAHTVDLAVRDIVAIHSGRGDDLDIELLTTEGYRTDDGQVVRALFGTNASPGTRVSLASLAAYPPERMAAYARHIEDSVTSRGYRTLSPAMVRWVPVLLFVLCILVIILFANVLPATVDQLLPAIQWATPLAFCVAVVLLIGLTRIRMPQTVLTIAGGRHRRYLDGIAEYLELAEADRLQAAQGVETVERVSSARRSYGDDTGGDVVNLYERLLPYAVLFGMEDSWAEAIRSAAPAAGSHPLLLSLATSSALGDTSRSIGRLAQAPSRSGGFSGSSGSSGGWSSSGSSRGGGSSGSGGGGGRVGGR